MMRSFTRRLIRPLVLAAAIALLTPATALAHTVGPDATPLHILTEVGLWGLGVLFTIGLVTAIFWLRANWIQRHRS
jgi:hypothetical protein